jgi:hypothetical protein
MALLADVYLWNEQYQKCIDLCDEIINSGLYSLEPSTSWFNLYNQETPCRRAYLKFNITTNTTARKTDVQR